MLASVEAPPLDTATIALNCKFPLCLNLLVVHSDLICCCNFISTIFYAISLAAVLNAQNLSSELATVVDWFGLGLNLGLPKHELDRIEHDYQGNDRRRVEMLDLWLRCTPCATWEDVVRALEQMGEKRVAENILQVHGEGK